MRLLALSTLTLTALVASPAHAEDSDFAQNSVTVGLSPFGGSIAYVHALSKQTTIQATIGGLPSGEVLADYDIEGTTYDITSGATWSGIFLNHRPSADADWFRFNFGFASGIIRNTLVDSDGNTYTATFAENPVAYSGIGFGFRPTKGFQYGLDIGFLFGAGAVVEGDPANTSDEAANIAGDIFFADVLPNIQLGVGWGF